MHETTTDPQARPDRDDLIPVARAAAIADRSVRTIRRAYSRGRLVAYRDGGGRGVRIRYGDLRSWMLSEEIAAPEREPTAAEELLGFSPTSPPAGELSETRALLGAARASRRHARSRAPARP